MPNKYKANFNVKELNNEITNAIKIAEAKCDNKYMQTTEKLIINTKALIKFRREQLDKQITNT